MKFECKEGYCSNYIIGKGQVCCWTKEKYLDWIEKHPVNLNRPLATDNLIPPEAFGFQTTICALSERGKNNQKDIEGKFCSGKDTTNTITEETIKKEL